MEICPEPGVLLQPELVVGLQPVNAPVFEGEKGHCPIDLVIVLQRIDIIILCQRAAKLLVQLKIGRVANPQHVDAVSFQPVAKLPIVPGVIGRNKNKVHGCPSVEISLPENEKSGKP